MMIIGCLSFLIYLGISFRVVHSDKCHGQNAVQECGRIPANPTNLPWHVTIHYSSKYVSEFRCYGTIVSPRIILTAETCIHEWKTAGKYVLNADPDEFEVVVNKIPRSQKSYKVKEFHIFNKTGPTVDANRFHEPVMIILEEKIVFNSDVYPACVEWTDPTPVSGWNGTTKVVKGEISGDTTPTIQTFAFSSHDACKEKWTYPYFVYYWARMMYYHGMLRRTNETFLHKKNFFCLVLGRENFYSCMSGSGVLFEKDNRYYIRGIANNQYKIENSFNGTSQESFKDFMRLIRIVANTSLAEMFERLSNGTITCEQMDLVLNFYPFVDLLKTPPTEEENWSENPQNLAGVIDLADYISWIKQTRDLIDL